MSRKASFPRRMPPCNKEQKDRKKGAAPQMKEVNVVLEFFGGGAIFSDQHLIPSAELQSFMQKAINQYSSESPHDGKKLLAIYVGNEKVWPPNKIIKLWDEA